MKKEGRRLIGALIGGIVAALGGVFCFLMRVALNAEAKSIEDGIAQLVQVGSEVMTKKEYLEYTAAMTSKVMVGAVFCFVVAIALFVIYFIQNKPKQGKEQNVEN